MGYFGKFFIRSGEFNASNVKKAKYLNSESFELTEIEEIDNINEALDKTEEQVYFGYNIFENNPYLNKEYLLGNIDEGYLIAPGDELRIMTYGDNSFEQNVTVDRNGNINISGYGLFFASGNYFKTLKYYILLDRKFFILNCYLIKINFTLGRRCRSWQGRTRVQSCRCWSRTLGRKP